MTAGRARRPRLIRTASRFRAWHPREYAISMHFGTSAYQKAESRLCIRRSDIFPSCVQCLQALAAPIPAISLWLCQLDRDDVEFATLASYLSTAEHHRAARFGTEVLRRRWITGRACLREALGVALGVAATRV